MAVLNNHGILGINARNLLYIRPYNKAKAVRMADSKLKTKHFLSVRGIPIPRLYGTIRSRDDLEKYDFSSLPDAFVLKPNSGAGGEGIVPIWGRRDGNYLLSGDVTMTQDEFEEHIADILEGRFSISGISDIAFFEQLLVCDERLARFAYKGLPDIRIVVHNLIPVMAMLRLPTKNSNGKANLHQGAIGVGIDIAKGEATYIVQGKKIIDEVPGVGAIRGLKIPYWDEILMISSKVQLETNLGYMAVDISIDHNTGPVLLEINARAGLGVQIANLAPLRRRLERIQGIKVQTPEKGVRVAKDMFGNVVEKEVKHITGREIVGSREPVKILVGAKPYRVMAHINPSIEKTLIDEAFAQKIGLLTEEEASDVESVDPKIKFILSGKRVQTIASLSDLSTKDYDLVVGRRDLNGFLVDPAKTMEEGGGIEALSQSEDRHREAGPSPAVIRRRNFRSLDRSICELDEQIKLLYHLKPVNLESERLRFLEGEVENPHFLYPELKFDAYQLREKLHGLSMDDSAMGRLYERKRLEILNKIDLLEHRSTDYFFDKSVNLFGEATADLIEAAQAFYDRRPDHFPKASELHTDTIVRRFERFFKEHDLSHWSVRLKKEMVADCVAGKRNVFFLREGVRFAEYRYKMVVAHEIQTHIFTAENGKMQPYRIFQRGTGDYLMTQEGLAIYNQEQVVDELTDKHFWNAALVLLVDVGQRSSFREVFERGLAFGYDKDRAFRLAVKVKRGLENTGQPGAFTKDLLYFRGKRMVETFVKNGGDLKRLYIGKIDLPSLEEIEALPFLRTPKHYPAFYSTNMASPKL